MGAKPTRQATGENAILEDLVRAATTRTLGTAEPWDYGWSQENYRRSPAAAISHDGTRSVQLSPEGVAAFEAAVNALLRRADMKRAWDANELWATVASMVGTLPFEDLRGAVERRLSHLTSASPTLTVLSIANLGWSASPLVGRDFVLGRAGPTWRNAVTTAAKKKPSIAEMDKLPWPGSNRSDDSGDAPVLFATWSDTQRGRAQEQARALFEHLFAVTLLLGPDPGTYNQYSLRGDAYRPGVRGLALHRPALQEAGRNAPEISRELVAQVLQRSTLIDGVTHHWWGGDPFPLDQILADATVRPLVFQVLEEDSAVHSRVRAAARWHSKAHWSLSSEDAVLTLGVGFDALLSERAGLPGRAVTERFALLEPRPELRAARAKLFSDLYSARSSVAHGGRASVIDRPNFARDMAQELRTASHRLLIVSTTASARSDAEIGEMFDSLKWGTLRQAAVDCSTAGRDDGGAVLAKSSERRDEPARPCSRSPGR